VSVSATVKVVNVFVAIAVESNPYKAPKIGLSKLDGLDLSSLGLSSCSVKIKDI